MTSDISPNPLTLTNKDSSLTKNKYALGFVGEFTPPFLRFHFCSPPVAYARLSCQIYMRNMAPARYPFGFRHTPFHVGLSGKSTSHIKQLHHDKYQDLRQPAMCSPDIQPPTRSLTSQCCTAVSIDTCTAVARFTPVCRYRLTQVGVGVALGNPRVSRANP